MRGVARSGFLRRMTTCAAMLAALVAGAPAQAQNRGAVRGAELNGFGRMIFTFEGMAKANAVVSSGVLVLSFDAPVRVDPEKIALEMPAYVTAARADPDGRGMRFALARPLRASLKEAGERLFLDLLPERWAGEAPGLPQDVVDDLARRAREAEEALRKVERRRGSEEIRSMPVRVGVRPTHTRLVFEMPSVVPVRHRRVDDKLEITFDAGFKIDAARLKAQVGDAMKSVEQTATQSESRFVIALPDKYEGAGFREDDTFVVDIIPPEATARRESPEAAALRAATAAAAAESKPAAPSPPAPEAPKTQNAAAQPPKPAAPIKAAAADAEPAAPRSAPAAPITRPISPVVSRDGDTLRISFGFAKSPPAAAFDRHGVVTLLFESTQSIDAGPTPALIKDAGGAWSATQSGSARLLRIAFVDPKLVRLAPDGEGWIATIGDRLAAASEPLNPTRTLDENGRVVVAVPFAGASRAHWIEDPETGERIAVSPAPAPLRSMPKSYRFAEFELTPTAHGVAVVAFTDDLRVRSGIDEVVIERGEGLAVTSRNDRAASPAATGVKTVIDRTQWAEALRGSPRDFIRSLEAKSSALPRNKRTPGRLELARGLFAHGLLAEARGALETVARDDPDAMRDRATAILRLAVAVRMRRSDDARKLLAENGLADEPEGLLWRAAMDAQQRNWPRAIAGFAASGSLLEAYPEQLQAMLRALWARASGEARDFGVAQAEIDGLERFDREFVRAEEIALLKARVDEAQGRHDDALAAYQRIYDGPDREAAAEAGLRGALLGLEKKTISREDAMARLEMVSVAWRGDGDIEAEALASLGRLYAEDNRWRDVFTIARRANAVYPNHEKMRALHDDAASMFETIFVEGKSDTLDRIQALALFHDFKELVPPGRRGDEIVRRLAERLVELDLLDNAADLLQHQIDYRVSGPFRSTLAARLAVIYLMNRKPAAALNALKSTRLAELPQPVKRARALLEARALSDLSRIDLAIEVASSEEGPDVDRLMADIHWQGRRWRAAGETYERILGDRWKDRASLSDSERTDVLRAAVAYALAEEPLSLDRMRGKYGPGMADSADARTFRLVTSPSAARAQEFRDLARQIARADTLAEFLEEYRKRYPDIPPTAPKRGAPPDASAQPPTAASPAPAQTGAQQASPTQG